jgi:hypothetical protein
MEGGEGILEIPLNVLFFDEYHARVTCILYSHALIFVSLLDSKLTNFHRLTIVFFFLFAVSVLDVKSGLLQARQRTA